ncbi:hypothetical protein Tco_1390698, partial [Tanacetum coccineum]
MFNRKVHHECMPVAPESDNHLNGENKSSNQDEMLSEYITLYPTTGISRSSANCTKSSANCTKSSATCRINDSDGNPFVLNLDIRPFFQYLENDTGMKRIFDKRMKNQAKTDKTEHGMEKRQKSKSKSTPTKSKVKADPEEILNGPT